MKQQAKLSAEQYAERISGVYSAIASLKSARDGEQAAELMRLNTAIDRLTLARLARKNEALSLRCGEAVKAAYQALEAAKPIGQFYPGMTGEESEHVNRLYYAECRPVAQS